MESLFRDQLLEALRGLEGVPKSLCSLRPVVEDYFKNDVADHMQKFLCLGPNGEVVGYLLLSSAPYPDSAKIQFQAFTEVRSLIGPTLAHHLNESSCLGQVSLRSFIFSPRFFPLSLSRFLRRWQHAFVGPRVYEWLEAVCEKTQVQVDSDEFNRLYRFQPRTLAHARILSPMAQKFLDSTLEKDAVDLLPKIACLAHNDLWPGNILLRSKASYDKFVIIDWGGFDRRGIPFGDSLRFAQTSKVRPSDTRVHFKKLFAKLGVDRVHLDHYAAAHMGAIYSRIEHFPLPRFAQLAHRSFEYCLELIRSLK